MSRKKKSLLDEIITGLSGIVFLLFIFIIITVNTVRTQGMSEYLQTQLIYLSILFLGLLGLLLVCLYIKARGKDDKSTKEASKVSKETIKPLDLEQAEKYLKIYNLPNSTQLYHLGDIYSTYPFETTPLERQIAQELVRMKVFNPNFIFLDSYIKNKNGKTSQTDVIAVGRRGVFVIEAKDYSGWIFGNGSQATWTETFYRKKTHFYNPIRQNKNHIASLKDVLGEDIKFHSLIVFGQDAEIKDVSLIPKDTYVLTKQRLHDLLVDIYHNQPECMTAQEVLEICRKINNIRITPDGDIRKEHIENIKDQTGEKRLYS